MHQRLLATIRRPKFILICLLVAGMLCNVAALYYLTLPPLFEHREKKNELAIKQRELEQMVALPPVVQASDEQIAAMLRKVPVKIDEVQLLTRLNRYAEESNVELDNVEIGKQAAARAGETSDGAAGSRRADDNGLLSLGQYDLKLKGTLPELMSFMDRLKQTEQIMDIARWNTVHINDSLNGEDGSLVAPEYWLYDMYVAIQTHSMPEYAEQFGSRQAAQGSSLEDALRGFGQKYPQGVQLDSVRSNN